jgi:hypothetical protein
MGFFSRNVKPDVEKADTTDVDLVDENKYRDTDEMIQEYKLEQQAKKYNAVKAKLDAKRVRVQRKADLRKAKRDISSLRRESLKQDLAPVRRVASGVSKAGQSFGRSMAKMNSGRVSPRNTGSGGGMFGQRGTSGMSFGSGGSSFDMSMGRGKNPFTFSGSRKGGMSLSMLGSSRSAPSRRKKSTKRKKRKR